MHIQITIRANEDGQGRQDLVSKQFDISTNRVTYPASCDSPAGGQTVTDGQTCHLASALTLSLSTCSSLQPPASRIRVEASQIPASRLAIPVSRASHVASIASFAAYQRIHPVCQPACSYLPSIHTYLLPKFPGTQGHSYSYLCSFDIESLLCNGRRSIRMHVSLQQLSVALGTLRNKF